MKILSAKQLKELDEFTQKDNALSEADLIENAAQGFVAWFNSKITRFNRIKIFAGPGNNGADGLTIARLLADQGYKIEVFIVQFKKKYSPGFTAEKAKLEKQDQVSLSELTDNISLPAIREDDIVIDAIFGYGINKEVTGLAASVIEKINHGKARVFAVDIPSGLNPDKISTGSVIRADFTCTFELPKLAFFFPENEEYVGEWDVVSIGLSREKLGQLASKEYYLNKEEITKYLPLLFRKKFSHKGDFGHLLCVGGSYGKIGAAVLMNKAALTAGAGLVTAHIPGCGYDIVQTAVPEVMVQTDSEKNFISNVPEFKKFDVIAVGPGLGFDNWRTEHAVKDLLANSRKPLVIDADAVNILANNPDYLKDLPKDAILTPHPQEFSRLFGNSGDSFARLKLLRAKAQEYKVFIVLKGAFSEIATPEGEVYFNETGNPGMATAGSGDVLTGIIAGLLAQLHNPLASCLLGVYLHGLAGDLARQKVGEQSVIASEIINHLGKAFLLLRH